MERKTRRLRIDLPTKAASGKSVDTGFQRPVALILDEDPTICLMLKLLLEVAAGIQVYEAHSDEQAIKLAASVRFNLLVTNLARPSIVNGLKFLKNFKHAYPRVPIIVVSGAINPMTRSRAMELGASACVSKLQATTKLLEAVNTALLHNRVRSASARQVRREVSWMQEVNRCSRGRWAQLRRWGSL